MKARAFGLTDVGCCRENNEDYLLIDEDLGLFVVCDGMGGHAAGEVASKTAAQVVARHLCRQRQLINSLVSDGDYDELEQLATDAVRLASRVVQHLGDRQPLYRGMGTTLTMLFIAGIRAIVAHVGDSRAYHVHGSGTIRRLTTDHTYANALVEDGMISFEEAKSSPFAHFLLRTIGRHDGLDVDSFSVDIAVGDRFVLCTDGLSNYFSTDEDLAGFMDADELQGIPNHLVDFATENGGRDNITAMVVAVENDIVNEFADRGYLVAV